MENFWQHPEGTNCAVVAVIKMAILQFGVGEVFKTSKIRDVHTVQLRNGRTISLTSDLIKKINKDNRIVFSKYKNKNKAKQLASLKAYVLLCYAVMVEYLHQFGYKNIKLKRKKAMNGFRDGFSEADDFDTDHLYKFLGLERMGAINNLKKRHLPFFDQKNALMLYSYTHVVAVSNGYYDHYGSRVKIDKDKKPVLGDDKAKWWYEVE